MTVRSFRRIRAGLLRSEEGGTLIEFGFIAPVLLIFIAGIVDLGRGLSEQHRLHQAVNRALEIPQVRTRENSYTFIGAEAASAAGVPVSAVTVEHWTECNGATRTWEDDCASTEPARFVRVTIVKGFAPMFGSMGFLNLAPNGTLPLTARGTLRVR
jgi:Flp pilus assembly protein TadG